MVNVRFYKVSVIEIRALNNLKIKDKIYSIDKENISDDDKIKFHILQISFER